MYQASLVHGVDLESVRQPPSQLVLKELFVVSIQVLEPLPVDAKDLVAVSADDVRAFSPSKVRVRDGDLCVG